MRKKLKFGILLYVVGIIIQIIARIVNMEIIEFSGEVFWIIGFVISMNALLKKT